MKREMNINIEDKLKNGGVLYNTMASLKIYNFNFLIGAVTSGILIRS